MRCHYDVLGLELTASSDEIKKSYRKCALQWHPDKHSDSSAEKREEANKRFLEIQDAYETLMDPNDRAWYDSHREILINGGNPGEPGSENYLFNIFPFFSSTCYKGFGDDEKGFYAIYRDMFATLAEDDRQFYDESVVIPEFGYSTSSYDEVVGPFYSFWLSYCTPRSFVWCEKHDVREAQDRYVRRIMEKENKKLIDKAKKERNEEIRKIVETVRKRDKRVIEYKKMMEEKTLAAQKKAQEKRDAERLKKIQEMKAYVEPEWSNVDKKLKKLDLSETESEEENEGDGEEVEEGEEELEDLDFDEGLFCVACDKEFKNEKSKLNHENSKKHKENVALLRQHMEADDEAMLEESKSSADLGSELETEKAKESVEAEEMEDSPKMAKLSRKDKKKRKNKKVLEVYGLSDLSDAEAEMSQNTKEVEEQKEEAAEKEPTTSNANNKTKSRKEKKQQKHLSEKLKSESNEKVAVGENDAPIDAEKSLTCTICEKEFETRNKLFEHIEAEGHAAPVQPLSYNQIKKLRIAQAKLKKAKK